MKKKIILLPLMLLALVACGQDNNSTSPSEPSTSTPSASTEPGSTLPDSTLPESTLPDSTTPDDGEELPTGLAHAGTVADPFNVADAIKVAQHVGETGTTNSYYIKGTVSQVGEIDTGSYGNGTFHITDDGSNDFYAFRVYYLDNQKFTPGDTINVGDEVVLCVKIVNYKGNTPENNGGGYVYSHTPSDSPVVPDEPIVASIQEVLEIGIALSGPSSVQYTIEGTVTAIVGNSYYIQEGDYAFYVYNKAIDGLQIGDLVRITSKITNYNGLVETTADANASATKIGEGTLVTPTEFTSLSDITQMHQSRLVTVKGLSYKSGSVTVGTSSGIKFDFGGEEIQVRTDKFLDDSVEQAIADKLNNLTENDTVDFTGVNVGWYNGAQLALTSADSIEVHKGEEVPVESVSAVASVEVEVGKSASLEAKVLPENATDKGLIYEVENPETAEVVNGKVKGLAEGTTNITVKAHADETKTATVAVTVVAASGPVETETATFTFTNALASGNQVIELKDSASVLAKFLTDGDLLPESASNIVKVYAGATGGNPDKGTDYVNRDVLKLGSSNVAGTLNLSFAEDVQISKVTLKMAVWANGVSLDINGVTNTCDAVMSKTVEFVTVEFNLDEATNILSFTTAGAKPSVCISEMVISYTK